MTVYDTAPLERYFEFEIEDLVQVKAQKRYSALNVEKLREPEPQVGQIIERSIHQCYGGVQIHYTVRMSGRSGEGYYSPAVGTAMQPVMFSQPELELADRPPAHTEQAIADAVPPTD